MSMTKDMKSAILQLYRGGMSVRAIHDAPRFQQYGTPEVEAVIREQLTSLEAFERSVLGSVTKEQETAINAIKNGEWGPWEEVNPRKIWEFLSQQLAKNQAVADWVVEQCRGQLDHYKVPEDQVDFTRQLAWKWFFGIPGDD